MKTDRRDAKKLAFLFRAGLLTEVQPPSEADEAARDLCRAREDAREDLVRSRHRITKFLLRRGMVFTGGKRAWTKAHRHWRLLIEAAWNYRHPPRVGTLARRRKGQPARVVALADRAMQRLYRRYLRLTVRGVPLQKAIVALVRELVGFVWAALSPLAVSTELPKAS